MKGKRIVLVATALLLAFAAASWSAKVEVSGSTAMTGNTEYDRNPSVCFDGIDYWLFWTKGDDTSTSGVRTGGYNPDADTYVVYYKKAGTPAGLASASETKLALSESARPAGFDQRVVSAVSFGGGIYAFVSSGQSGTDRGLYYYFWNGSNWTGPTTLIDDATAGGGHVNVTTDGSYCYVVWESEDASSDFYAWDGGTLYAKVDISTDNQPKIALVGTTLYVVSIEDGTGDIECYSAAAGTAPSFSAHSTAIAASGFYDPCIFSDGTDLYVVTAPYDGGNDQQYLVETVYSGGSWSTVNQITLGGYGGTYWWEYWPCGYHDGSTPYVFFTTETSSPAFSDGEIAMLAMDWDLANDHYCWVQSAVDAAAEGDVIEVAAGTYREQVHISADMTVTGAGVDSTVIVSPVTLADYFMTGSHYNYPVVFADGADVALADMTVDGDNRGDSNYRFVGVGYWNGGGSMTDMEVLNVMNSTFSGAQHGVGIYSYNDEGGPYALSLTNVVVGDYQKTGIALFGDGMTVDLDGVTTIGQGATDVTAQNGIQVGYGAGGTLDDIEITGNYWTGDTWTASGFLPSDGTSVTVDGMLLDGNQTSIYMIDIDGSFNDVTVVNPYGDALYAYPTAATRSPMPRREASPFDSELGGRGGRYDMTASFTNSTFTGADVADSWGPSAFVEGGSCDFTVTGCDISHWDYGVVAYEYGGPVTSHVHDNLIYLNGTYGMYTNATPSRATQDATGNWWGDASGPYHDPLNPSGLGDAVSDGIDFDSWLTSNIICDPDPEYLTAAHPTKTIAVNYLGGGGGGMYGYSISFSWDGAVVSTTTGDVAEGNLLSDLGGTFFYAADGTGDEIIVDCALLGDIAGATAPGTLFTIDFTGLAVGTSDIDVEILNVRDQYNNPLTGFAADDGLLIVDVSVPTIADVEILNTTLLHTDDYIKNTDGAKVTATVLDDDPAFGAGNIVADLRGLGGGQYDNPGSYNGTTGAAVWTIAAPPGVTCDPNNGTVWVYVDATDGNGNTAAQGSDDIIADNDAPSAVTGFDASPGHEQCDLAWTMGSDNYVLAGVTVRRTANAGDYPIYPAFVGAWPAVDSFYAANYTAGTEVYNGTGTAYTDGIVDRNIYYYQAFCYDEARNYGVAEIAGGSRDLATNYWLGDVTDGLGGTIGDYDGTVYDGDIEQLGWHYHQVPGTAPYYELDVGPTVHPDYGRLGLPTPDNFVGFEDLMIFAMNYDVVTPRIVPLLPGLCDRTLALSIEEVERSDDGLVLALVLAGNTDEVKGVSAELELDGLEFVGAALSDDMSSPIARTFLWAGADQSSVLIDLAVMGEGVTIGGSGELARVTLTQTAEEFGVEFASATIRGVENRDLTAELNGMESSGGLPAEFRLVQNAPNPFNPMTTIAFHVPYESDVSIRVYDVSGRVVRTLVDGVTEAGRHAAVWDGRNDNGGHCGSGVYFCVMETPEYSGSHKMMLLK
jgi:hypothetical protein